MGGGSPVCILSGWRSLQLIMSWIDSCLHCTVRFSPPCSSSSSPMLMRPRSSSVCSISIPDTRQIVEQSLDQNDGDSDTGGEFWHPNSSMLLSPGYGDSSTTGDDDSTNIKGKKDSSHLG